MRILLVFLLALWQSVVKGQINVLNCLAEEKFQFHSGGQLKQNPWRKDSKVVDTGAHIVFRLYRSYDCPDVYDEDVSLTLLWQIPLGATTFDIRVNQSDSLTAPIYYSAGGTGPGRRKPHFYKWSTGRLMGHKNGEDWQVELNIQVFYFDVYADSIGSREYRGSYVFKPWKKARKEPSFLQWAW